MSLFSAVEMAPRDPILGLNEAFNADTRPHKVNLGVGVYYNEAGRIPLLKAVALAEKARRKHMRHVATYLLKGLVLTTVRCKTYYLVAMRTSLSRVG